MTSKILSRRDIAFLLYEWLDVESLTTRPRFADHSRETFDAALTTCEQIATDLFEPHNKKSDQHEPQFDGERVTMIPEIAKALTAFCDAGLMAAGRDYELGGMQLPAVVEKAGFAWFKAANVGTSSYPFLTIGNSNLLLAHGSDEQIERFVKPMMTGRFFGTMCLSETQAGSSLSDVKTRAVPQGEGTYRLFGNKMWISAGEHDLSENIVHLVLAKIPEADGSLPAGVKGISLFIVPKFLVNEDGTLGERNDVVLAGLNHKMGYRGTTNCLLNFGEGKFRPKGEAGAIGYLVGEPNKGLAQMFHMMNEARIGVGLGATALGITGYLHALDYARNRPQGRPLVSKEAGKDSSQPQVPIIAHADVKRMLLAQKAYVEGALALNLYCAKLVDDERTGEDDAMRREAGLLLDILTPIAKSWPSQWCLEANNLAIQVHGGYGYTRDYNVEQFYRDNRLNPIHEGTHGIQGLDLLGRKVVMQGGAALHALSARVRATIARCKAVHDPGLQRLAGELDAQWTRLEEVTATLHAAGDANRTLANATVYLEAFGHLVVGWIWLEQALVAGHSIKGDGSEGDDENSDAFYFGKLAACRYFFAYEVPKVGPMLDLLAALDTTTLTMQDAWF
jgi:alkylation response protein AidB-like acyl-CoA dehydrogenase